MDKIPESALDTIIATKARDMYRPEFLAMAIELKELRRRFNVGEDKQAAPIELKNWSDAQAADWAKRMVGQWRALLKDEVVTIYLSNQDGDFLTAKRHRP